MKLRAQILLAFLLLPVLTWGASVSPIKFEELGERLEKIREKHEQGLINSLEFLKAILARLKT